MSTRAFRAPTTRMVTDSRAAGTGAALAPQTGRASQQHHGSWAFLGGGSAIGVLLPVKTGTTGTRKGLTSITVTWCFLDKIITNNARVFIVATVVPPDLLFEAVCEGPLAACACYIVHVDGPPSFPKVRHGPRPGGAPAREHRG